MFLSHCKGLRLHHFILEKAFSKSKPLFLNLKQDLSFYFYFYFLYFFWLKNTTTEVFMKKCYTDLTAPVSGYAD